MLNRKFIAALLASLAFASSATAASSEGETRFTFEIRGFVPVICRASLEATAVPTEDPGVVSLGRLTEFCNSGAGYEVWADYSPELADATLIVNGQPVELSEAGSTRIVVSNQPAMTSRDVSLSLPEGGISGSLSVRVVAL